MLLLKAKKEGQAQPLLECFENYYVLKTPPIKILANII